MSQKMILNECNTIQTRRQVRLWLKDFASKSVTVALEESTPSDSMTANIKIVTGANSGYFKQLKIWLAQSMSGNHL